MKPKTENTKISVEKATYEVQSECEVSVNKPVEESESKKQYVSGKLREEILGENT